MRKVISLPLGGMYSAASGPDPSLIPDGYVAHISNLLFRPGPRLTKRPAALAEASAVNTGFAGWASWEDTSNQVVRLAAFVTNGSNTDIYFKDTSGETFGTAKTGTNTIGSPSSYANYRGSMYYTTASGVPAAPLGLFRWDGTAVRTNPLGGETLYSLTVAPFIDRLFLGYVKTDVTNQLGTTTAYDSTSWTATNVTTANITNGSTVVSRIIPTNTTTASIRKADVYTVAASTTDTSLVYRSDLRNTSSTYEMPMRVEIYYSQVWEVATAYAAGAIRVPTTLNGFRYRVTVAGTSHATTEPATWPTTIGSTVIDNTVTWICDGVEEVASQPVTLPTITQEQNFLPWWCKATLPPNPASTKVGVRLKFGTPATSTIALHGVDISLKDGVTDGVLTKANKGQQLTVGKFFYPFFNQESSATATMDLENDVYWTETSDPSTIVGDNFQRLSDLPGRVSACAVVGGRIIFFKKRGMWVFQGSTDPDNPLIRERFFENVGCVGPRAVTVFEDRLYFIGDAEVYSYRPGGEPEPLGGDGMREAIRPSGSLLETTSNLRTSVAVDTVSRDVWFASVGSPAYIYNIDKRWWSSIQLAESGGQAFEISNFIWNPNTAQVYGSRDTTPVPVRWGAGNTDTVALAAGAITQTLTFPPLEVYADAERHEYVLNSIDLKATGAASLTATAQLQTISSDAAAYSSKTNAVTMPSQSGANRAMPTTRIPLRQSGCNVRISLSTTSAFTIHAASANVRVLGPERPRSTPTQGSASL